MRLGFGILASFLAVALQAESALALDLLERYPTRLSAGDTNPNRAREWAFEEQDIFRVTQFTFEVGDQLRLKLGAADVGIGHCRDGAVWAVVMPRELASLRRTGAGEAEPVSHVWLRFHPAEIAGLFPAETVFPDGNKQTIHAMRAIVNAKLFSSWHAGERVTIPERKDFTVDVDTTDQRRRFFVVDKAASTAGYIPQFEGRAMKHPPAITRELAAEAFDQIWKSFDEQYAMFGLRPEVHWEKLREELRPKAIESKSAYEFSDVVVKLLRPLRDLHVWCTVAGANIPVFSRARPANANPGALPSLIGRLNVAGPDVRWAITPEKIGYILIARWNDPESPTQVDKILEEMRDTRGLIIDVRLNGGGSEPLAGDVAGRFLGKAFTYAFHQLRNGPKHSDLTERRPRTAQPRGPWRYDRPVVVLIGQRCLSSNESFVKMMTGSPDVLTMGDRTGGSSGNPRILKLPMEMTVSVPRWIDFLADGTPLDERGVQPQVRFEPRAGAFEGERDDLLSDALERLRKAPLPQKPIAGPAYLSEAARGPRALRRPPERLSNSRLKNEIPTADQPRVISVSPAEGASDVPGNVEIKVRFDRPMDSFSVRLNWDSGGFLDCEYPRYDPARYEFTIPVQLAPGALHQITVNESYQNDHNSSRGGFHSTNLASAAFYVWRFETGGAPAPTAGESPKAVSVTPPDGSTIPSTGYIDLKFDQEMLPAWKASPYIYFKPGEPGSVPGIVRYIDFNADARSYRVPIAFPPNQKVGFTIAGFRSASGKLAEPLKLEYRTTAEHFASADRERAQAAAKDARLLSLLGTLQEKRRQLTAVSERVQILSLRAEDGVFTSLESKSAQFKWEKPNRYFGDVSQIMNSVMFSIGSDGQNWWMHYQTKRTNSLVVCPASEIGEFNLSISDPFDLSRKSAEQAAIDLQLGYAGVRPWSDKTAHLVEAWNVQTSGNTKPFVTQTQWWIDPDTGRLNEVKEHTEYGITRTRYHYEAINAPIPPEDFSVPVQAGRVVAVEPLGEGFTNRFVNLKDGSSDRMSLRWGKKGPGRVSSGGLN